MDAARTIARQQLSGTSGPPSSSRLERETFRIPQRVRGALLLLLDSYYYALDLECNLWEFAVDLPSLRRLGLSQNDYRWLVRKGFVDFAQEVTSADEERRSFRRLTRFKLTRSTCFILTDAGLLFAQEQNGRSSDAERYDSHLPGQLPTTPILHVARQVPSRPPHPIWDRDRQELRVGNLLVKQFKAPAANQEMILAAFEEEQWPRRIDDPLPPRPEQDSKRRLHDTINSLNRNQRNALIRFLGDGSGQGVRWEFVDKPPDPSPE